MNWIWLIAGVVLILAEFVIPGFVICFFGAAAMVVGAVLWVFPCIAFAWQLLAFAVLGVVLLLACRRYMPGIFRGSESVETVDIDDDGISGERCVCAEVITPDVPGKVDFRGSLWNAAADEEIVPGDNCVVISRNNLTLKVRKIR